MKCDLMAILMIALSSISKDPALYQTLAHTFANGAHHPRSATFGVIIRGRSIYPRVSAVDVCRRDTTVGLNEAISPSAIARGPATERRWPRGMKSAPRIQGGTGAGIDHRDTPGPPDEVRLRILTRWGRYPKIPAAILTRRFTGPIPVTYFEIDDEAFSEGWKV